MLIVKQNTYPNVDLNPGDEVQWIHGKKCYHLYKASSTKIVDKAYFASPDCNKDGIKPNGKQVNLVGIVAQVKSKGYILELENV